MSFGSNSKSTLLHEYLQQPTVTVTFSDCEWLQNAGALDALSASAVTVRASNASGSDIDVLSAAGDDAQDAQQAAHLLFERAR